MNVLEDIARVVEERYPDLFKVCYPRRLVPPQGYLHPKYKAVLDALELLIMKEPIPLSKTNVDCIMAIYKVIDSGVPVYAVANDFITALMMTEPPPDLKLSDLRWPHNGMHLLLPDAFQQSYFGHKVPYMTIAKVDGGWCTPPAAITKVMGPTRKMGFNSQLKTDLIECDAEPDQRAGFIVTATVLTPRQGGKWLDHGELGPIDYAASWPIDSTIAEFFNESEFFFEQSPELTQLLGEDGMTKEQDGKLLNKLVAMGAQLLFAMGELPQHVEPEATCIRLEKIKKHGAIKKEALWLPPWIGKNYHHEKGESQDGHHASPYMHPRKGHWRYQAHGPKLALRYWKWIKPVIVAAGSKV